VRKRCFRRDRPLYFQLRDSFINQRNKRHGDTLLLLNEKRFRFVKPCKEEKGTVKETEKRIESKISRTAEFTCISRAASFYEKTPEYRSNDFIATKLVPRYLTPLIKNRVIKNWLMNRFFAIGTYEYVIARTKYIDSIFQKAILSGFDQILLFGAGFDSRGIRFASENTKTKIFEMDVPITQDAKIR